MSRDIGDMVRDCQECAKHRKAQAEPIISTPTPEMPWQKLGSDLLLWCGKEYVLVVDYFSRYIEIARLENNTTSQTVVNLSKSIFARHRVPQQLISDNWPQYISETFLKYSNEYGFQHITSSPR
ncbi:uncharacterized protein LOC117335875 [Pecten maximus]|uniref:uncharacterized protein LOC117335875 n=1 Tax=Pecten maximus TaxID=6579 RepID=UPI001458F0FF|nr:uncharacterized protein LOC117335875 [Pecten maximus]